MMRRPFRVGDRVTCDYEHRKPRLGTVVNEWPRKVDMWVRFDDQPADTYTVVSKNYMTFSQEPLDRLVNEV